MTSIRLSHRFSLAALFLFFAPFTAPAQQMMGGPVGASAGPIASAPSTGSVSGPQTDLRPMTRLSGHVAPWAQSARDVGPVPDTAVLHLDVLLKRAPAQQAAFDQLLADQQNPKSPRYHSWLTPAQIGLVYGPPQAEVDALSGWLTEQGLTVEEVTPSRTFVRVTAPASTVERAFATSLDLFQLGPKPDPAMHFRSATTEPAIPSAFTGLVAGIGGLTEAPDQPMHRMELAAPEPAASSPATLQPQYTSGSGAHYVAPGDFAILYDVPAATSSANDGTGQKVAIIGRSRVNPADITNYLTSVGLPPKIPNVVIPPLGVDPGQAGGGDQGEATLDVQRVLGTAPGAQADLVVATNASGGLRVAIQYNVQTLLDPVMTISFGACEASAGLANVQLYTALFAQAAAEGISVFVSAGDSGAAGCDAHGTAPPTGTQIASINYICSSGFATCVGGTEFNEGANPAQYWSATNSANRTSALSYIPEGVWNEPGNPPMLTIGAGGGGVSTYIAKPAFQAGPGVPSDGFRDTPDVSFTSAGHDAYFGCYAASGGTCTVDPTTGLFHYVGFYGTSAAAPSMAGVAALLNQSLGSAQGNLNPLLYRLGANAANGAFHDATVASSGVTGCTAAVPSLCNNSTPSATALTGGLAGYLLTPGYDLASGLGSPDVAKLFAAAISAGIPTTTAITGSSGTIPPGQSLSFTATVAAGSGGSSLTPTGTVQFFENGIPLGAAVAVAANRTASLTIANQLPVGNDLVTATYSGDTTFAGSNSAALALTIQPGLTASVTTFTATPNPVFTNQFSVLKVAVASGTGTGPVPMGSVSLYISNGVSKSLVTTGALAGGVATFNFSFSTATFNFSASYAGDGTYAPSASPVVAIVSTAGPTTTVLTGNTSLPAASTLTVTATINNLPLFATNSSITLMDGMSVLGTIPAIKPINATSLALNFTSLQILSTGIHSITAYYAGDLQSQSSTSVPLIVAVGVPQAITVTPAAAALTFTAGATQGNTDVLTIGSAGAFAGTVTVACTITYNGTATAIFAPTCTPSNGSVPLTPQGTATTTLSITTTAQHAMLETKPFPWLRSTGIMLALLAFLPLAGLRRRQRWKATAVAFCITAGLLAMAGCGGSGGAPAPAPLNGTTPGSYTITVTSTGTGTGNVSATTTISLSIQ